MSSYWSIPLTSLQCRTRNASNFEVYFTFTHMETVVVSIFTWQNEQKMSIKKVEGNKNFFVLNFKELQRLSECESGIVLRKDCPCRLKLSYSVLPVHSKAFRKAVSEKLNERVLKYNSDLNDMILKYFNIRIRTPIEATRHRNLSVLCIADVYVFKPQLETVLTATVNKKSNNHLGCLMYNVFNVSIIKPPDLPFAQWAGRKIEVGDSISFKVSKVDVREVIPYIIGEIQTDYSTTQNDEKDSVISTDRTSFVTSEERYSELEDVLETLETKKPKKRKHAHDKNVTQETGAADQYPKHVITSSKLSRPNANDSKIFETKKSQKRKHALDEEGKTSKKRKLM